MRIGTRASALALRQTEIVAAALRAAWPALRCRLVPLSTTGDRELERPIPTFGGKGVFTLEIEAALAEGRIDLAVHSLKDLPTEERPGLVVGAVTEREDPGDVLVALGGGGLADLPPGARVGTSSLRRAAQLRAARRDLRPESVRGNVETRLRKLDEGAYDAVVLARAGLLRLGLERRVTEALSPDVMLPAPGQGALAVQRRAGDDEAARLLAPLHHRPTALAVAAERAFLAALGAGCSSPVAALAEIRDERLTLRGLTAMEDGSRVWRAQGTADPEEHAALGRDLAGQLQRRMAAEGPAAAAREPVA